MNTDATTTTAGFNPQPEISLALAMLPILLLFVVLSLNIWVFGEQALQGSSQMVIILVTGCTAVIAMFKGAPWHTLQSAIVANVTQALPSIFILLLVGALASVWVLSGTVPLLVYHGVRLLNPELFLLVACVASALTSIVVGSSWSTAATIGIALVGVGRALGIPEGLVAGAIISGAYFGDKVSPLSDTTNLASVVTGTPIFRHIQYLLYTTVPAMAITLLAYGLIGINLDTTASNTDVAAVANALTQYVDLSLWGLVPPVVVLGLIIVRVDAVPALFVGVVSGVICALLGQGQLLSSLAGDSPFSVYRLFMNTMATGGNIETDSVVVNGLLSGSGMAGMLNTIWLIMAAMAFGGVIEASGMLSRIMAAIRSVAGNFFRLVCCTAGTCVATNLSAADQSLAVAVPGRMYADVYRDMGYAPENLSRTLEDTGTVTSVLVPWSTGGAYHASLFGIATLTYLPYCFFYLLSPAMTLIFAWGNIKIRRVASHSYTPCLQQSELQSNKPLEEKSCATLN